MTQVFDQSYYLKMKLAQVKSAGYTDADGKAYTASTLLQGILNSGYASAQDHYEQAGRSEGLNPNAYFNELEYLQAKANQLISLGITQANGLAHTVETILQGMASMGMTPAEHYENIGAYETTADGHYLNPSNAFDANAYFMAKLLQLHGTDALIDGRAGDTFTMREVLNGLQASGMSPITHYMLYGAGEANASGIPLLQTVPMGQRVPNDPGRNTTGDTVPANYNAGSLAPMNITAPTPLLKPADVGGLASTQISPAVVHPASNLPVPGDSGYIAPPAGLTDTKTSPLVAPTTTGTGNATDYWVKVNTSDGSATLYNNSGTEVGTLPAGSVSTGGNGGIVIPPTTPTTGHSAVHAVATLAVNNVVFHDDVADTFKTAFGSPATEGTPGTGGSAGTSEVQQITLDATAVTANEYTLTVGSVTLTATPAAGDLADLAAKLQTAAATANAPFTIAANGTAGLTITFTATGAQVAGALAAAAATTTVDATETTDGVDAVNEEQTVALSSVTASEAYSFTIDGVDLTATPAEATLASLAEAMQAAVTANGTLNVTVTATDTGIVITYNDGGDIATLATITPPATAAEPITATVTTAPVEAQNAEAVIAVASVAAEQYVLTVDAETLTVTPGSADLAALVAALTGDASYAAKAFTVEANADNTGLLITMKNGAAVPATVTLAPATAVTSVAAVETTAGDDATAEVQLLVLADAAIQNGAYTLTVGATTLAATITDTNTLADLVTQLTQDAGYAAAAFELAATADGIEITYKAVGAQTDAISLALPVGVASLTGVSVQDAVAAVYTVETIAIAAVVANEEYTFSDGTNAPVTAEPADATLDALVTALTAQIPDYANADYVLAVNQAGTGIELQYKTAGDKVAATLTPTTALPVEAVETTPGVTGVAEIQSIALTDVAVEEYTLTYGSDSITATPADATLDALATALNTEATNNSAGFTVTVDGANGLTITYADPGNVVPAVLSSGGGDLASYTATVITPGTAAVAGTPGTAGTPATPSTSSLNVLDSITDFNYLEDHIIVPTAPTSLAKGTLTGTTASAFTQATASVGANQAGLYSFGSDYYLFVNDSDAAFSADADIVIKLVGITADEAAAMTADIFATA